MEIITRAIVHCGISISKTTMKLYAIELVGHLDPCHVCTFASQLVTICNENATRTSFAHKVNAKKKMKKQTYYKTATKREIAAAHTVPIMSR